MSKSSTAMTHGIPEHIFKLIFDIFHDLVILIDACDKLSKKKNILCSTCVPNILCNVFLTKECWFLPPSHASRQTIGMCYGQGSDVTVIKKQKSPGMSSYAIY